MNKVNPQQPPFFQPHQIGSREHSIQSHYANLHSAIGDFMLDVGSTHCLEIIKDLYLHRSVALFEKEDGVNPIDRKVTITSRFTDDILVLMELMIFLSKLEGSWSSIEQISELNGFKRP